MLGELRRQFSPEFLNRVDEIVVFHQLDKTHLTSILDILLRELNLRLVDKGVEIEVDDEVAWLIKEGYEPLYGARPMRRTIQRAIGDPLSEEMIKGRFKESRKIRVVLRDGAPTFHRTGGHGRGLTTAVTHITPWRSLVRPLSE